VGCDREDRFRVHGHPRFDARASVGGKQLVVVRDDPVVDPHHRPVAHRMVVGGDRGMPLRVVPDVDEQLVDLLRHRDAVEQLRRRRALLDDGGVRLVRGPVGIADGVSASFGDRSKQGLRGQRPL